MKKIVFGRGMIAFDPTPSSGARRLSTKEGLIAHGWNRSLIDLIERHLEKASEAPGITIVLENKRPAEKDGEDVG